MACIKVAHGMSCIDTVEMNRKAKQECRAYLVVAGCAVTASRALAARHIERARTLDNADIQLALALWAQGRNKARATALAQKSRDTHAARTDQPERAKSDGGSASTLHAEPCLRSRERPANAYMSGFPSLRDPCTRSSETARLLPTEGGKLAILEPWTLRLSSSTRSPAAMTRPVPWRRRTSRLHASESTRAASRLAAI